jgi:serine/threonine-protein kinase RsbW
MTADSGQPAISSSADSMTVEVSNSHTECDKIFRALQSFLQQASNDTALANDLKLVIEETFSNIVNYAYTEPAQQPVHIRLARDSERISITFIDQGMAFNPLEQAEQASLGEDLSDGGMGLHIIDSLSDELHYQRIGEQNVFTVIKHYNQNN